MQDSTNWRSPAGGNANGISNETMKVYQKELDEGMPKRNIQSTKDVISLLNLPIELRLEIYTHLFTATFRRLGEKLSGILKVNRQIYTEAIILYHQQANFIF